MLKTLVKESEGADGGEGEDAEAGAVSDAAMEEVEGGGGGEEGVQQGHMKTVQEKPSPEMVPVTNEIEEPGKEPFWSVRIFSTAETNEVLCVCVYACACMCLRERENARCGVGQNNVVGCDDLFDGGDQ